MDDDTQSPERQGGDALYRIGQVPGLCGGLRADRVAPELAELMAALLTEPLSVRAFPARGRWFVRCELWSTDGELMDLLLRQVPGLRVRGSDSQSGPRDATGPVSAFTGARPDVASVADLDPTWSAVLPGMDYMEAYEEAYRVRDGLFAVLSNCLLSGPVAVVPFCSVKGRPAVRFDLTLWDAERVRVLLSYVGEHVTGDGNARS